MLALALAVSMLGGACGGPDDSLVLIGGEHVDAAAIDRDPLALLPSGVIVLGYLDAATMFASGFGPDVSRVVANVLPIGPESGFVPSRDLVRLYGGIYAMQGADWCVVAQGSFDVDAIRRAADARAQMASGVPLVKSRYAGNDVYTAGNVGFVVLTPHTLLAGNETGMRRALDRLRDGKLERSVPAWMIELASTKGAAFAMAGDVVGQPAVEAAARQAPFVGGLRRARIVGNFQPPGLNFAGSLSYADAPSAASAAAGIQNLSQLTQFMSLLSTWGFGGAMPEVRVAQQGADLAFTAPFDDRFVRWLLSFAAEATRKRW